MVSEHVVLPELTTIEFIIQLALQKSLVVKKTFLSFCLRNASLPKSWRPSNFLYPLGILIGRNSAIWNCSTVIGCRNRNGTTGSRRREVILIGRSIILFMDYEYVFQEERTEPTMSVEIATPLGFFSWLKSGGRF